MEYPISIMANHLPCFVQIENGKDKRDASYPSSSSSLDLLVHPGVGDTASYNPQTGRVFPHHNVVVSVGYHVIELFSPFCIVLHSDHFGAL